MEKSRLTTILVLILAVAMCAGLLAACGGGGSQGGEKPQDDPGVEAPGGDPVEEGPAVVTLIEDIDTADMLDMPLEMESVTLYEDGRVKVVPTGEMLAYYEGTDVLEDGGVYPFDYIDKVKEIYLVRFGNGGYRTVIALMEDGSLFAFSAKDLLTDHKLSVYGDIGGVAGFTDVQQIQDEGAFGVLGITEGGEEILLDPYLN
ncbi:MAG: hypothetical protein K6D56_06830 [Clostridia bacterium]|nr:hypothetical protein [Clostridia bacterium]